MGGLCLRPIVEAKRKADVKGCESQNRGTIAKSESSRVDFFGQGEGVNK